MSSIRPALTILEEEFLPVRAKLLEIGASLDRIERAEGAPTEDPRAGQIRAAIEALLSPTADRAERIQQIFSLSYDETWLENFRLASGK